MTNSYKLKIGRNTLCPCGSGNKYKHCCINKNSSEDNNLEDELLSIRESVIKPSIYLKKVLLSDSWAFVEMLSNALIEHNNKKYERIVWRDNVFTQVSAISKKQRAYFIFHGVQFLQMSLLRSELLIQGILQSLNAQNDLIGILSTRAHYEIVGSLGFFVKKYQQYHDGRIDWKEMWIILTRLLMGDRSEKSKSVVEKHAKSLLGEKYSNSLQLFKAYNVLNLITAAEQVLGIESSIRNGYDILSEYCHPNRMGLQIAAEWHLNADVCLLGRRFNQVEYLHFSAESVKNFLNLYEKAWNLMSPLSERVIYLGK